MARPPAAIPPVSAPDVPELVAEIRRWRQDLTAQMSYYQRMDRWFRDLQERLGFPDDVADDDRDVAQVRLLDDLRGQVEHTTTRLHAVEVQLAGLTSKAERLSGALEVYTIGVAELGVTVEARCLASDQFSVQANELLRNVLEVLRNQPQTITNAVAAAIPSPSREVEVGAGARPRRAAAPASEERVA